MSYLADLILVSIPAAITGAGAIIVFLLQSRRNERELARRVGDPNGQGNVVEMLERALKHQWKQDERTSQILTRLGRIEAGQRRQDERIEKLENAA